MRALVAALSRFLIRACRVPMAHRKQTVQRTGATVRGRPDSAYSASRAVPESLFLLLPHVHWDGLYTSG